MDLPSATILDYHRRRHGQVCGESHLLYGSIFEANWHGQSIVADAEQSAKAWTYRWVTPIPGSTLAFHGTDNWYQFLGVQTGCDNFVGILGDPTLMVFDQ